MPNTDVRDKSLDTAWFAARNTKCPQCGSTEFLLRNYSLLWKDGDIHCARCGAFIRKYDEEQFEPRRG